MNAQDKANQQGSSSQQGAANQASGGQAQQRGSGSGQQGGQSSGGSAQQGTQQEGYSPSAAQQGGALSRRGGLGGMPSLFGSRGSSPFEMFRRLDEDMDRLFHQIWGGGRSLMRGRGTEAQSMWMPQVEVCEQGGKLHVYADLPGMKKEDVKLSLEGDQLVLQGERQSSREEGEQGSGFYHSERSYGSFYRSVPLPEGVDPQTVQASFKDGVLDVTFEAPSKPQHQSRQIEIR